MTEESFRSAADEMYDELLPQLDDLDDVRRELASDMLRTYCWYSVHVEELTREIDDEGPVIETPKGPRPNPANTVLHQYAQRKSDYYSKVMHVLPQSNKQQLDKLAAFVTRK